MRLQYFKTVLGITLRCYFNEVTQKPHRVAISKKLLENHIALLFHRRYSKITSRCYFTEITRNHIALLFHRSTGNHIALLFPTNQDAYCWFWILIELKFLNFRRFSPRFQDFLNAIVSAICLISIPQLSKGRERWGMAIWHVAPRLHSGH